MFSAVTRNTMETGRETKSVPCGRNVEANIACATARWQKDRRETHTAWGVGWGKPIKQKRNWWRQFDAEGCYGCTDL